MEETIDADPVAVEIRLMVADLGYMETTAQELLGELNREVSPSVQRLRLWPKSSSALSGRLRKLAEPFRRIGIEIEFAREANRRPIYIRQTGDGTPGKRLGRDDAGSASDDSERTPKRRRHRRRASPDGPRDDDDGSDDGQQTSPEGRAEENKRTSRYTHKPNIGRLKKLVEEEEREARRDRLKYGKLEDDYVP